MNKSTITLRVTDLFQQAFTSLALFSAPTGAVSSACTWGDAPVLGILTALYSLGYSYPGEHLHAGAAPTSGRNVFSRTEWHLACTPFSLSLHSVQVTSLQMSKGLCRVHLWEVAHYIFGSMRTSACNCCWYFCRRSQRGQDFMLSWQHLWKTVLQSLHLQEKQKQNHLFSNTSITGPRAENTDSPHRESVTWEFISISSDST